MVLKPEVAKRLKIERNGAWAPPDVLGAELAKGMRGEVGNSDRNL